jgi:predicted helicase
VKPEAPFYLLRPQDAKWLQVYQEGWKLTDIFGVNVLGFQSHRDHFAVDFDYSVIQRRAQDLRDDRLSDETIRERYSVRDNRDWELSFARATIKSDDEWRSKIIECAYRPFDNRYCYYSDVFMDYPRRELLDHVAGRDNVCLLASRQQGIVGFRHAWISLNPPNDCVVSTTSREANQAFPLYVYPSAAKRPLPLGDEAWPGDPCNDNRSPNLSPAFIEALSKATGLSFVPAQADKVRGDQFGPEDVLAYIYAILNCPTYRVQFAEYLRMDFPRIPVTSDPAQFGELAVLGRELVALHTERQQTPGALRLGFPVAGSNRVARRHPRYVLPAGDAVGRVYINAEQYIDGVPEDVWEFRVGGFQVAQKWLSERVERSLDYDDVTKYQNVLQAIARTIEITAEIDEAIPAWPLT